MSSLDIMINCVAEKWPIFMDKITKIDTIEEYCQLLGAKSQHPLVNVTYFSELPTLSHGRKEFGFYCVYFNEMDHGLVIYGRGEYGYKEDTMFLSLPVKW